MADIKVRVVEDDPNLLETLKYAHNLERAADRVTNICERVVYVVTVKMEEIGASRY
jgi:phosphate transport system protein